MKYCYGVFFVLKRPLEIETMGEKVEAGKFEKMRETQNSSNRRGE